MYLNTNNLKLLDYNTIGEIPNEINNKKYIKKYEQIKEDLTLLIKDEMKKQREELIEIIKNEIKNII